jgi:heat shock protein HtpX
MTSPLSSSHRLQNALQTLALLAAMAALAGYLGWTLFGQAGLWAAALGPVFALLGNGGSSEMILRLTRARPLAPEHAPGLYRLAGLLAERARLPRMPRLYRVPAPALNAFAAGSRDNPAIALTDGLLASLEPRELAGVLAHELSHLRSNDVWVMTLAAVVGRMTSLMSFFGQILFFILIPISLFTGQGVPLAAIVLLIFAPTISGLLQLALSRTREFDADIAAIELTGDPRGLAAALTRLERQRSGWMQRIFMARAPGWLQTHPSTAERIRRLMEIEREHALA